MPHICGAFFLFVIAFVLILCLLVLNLKRMDKQALKHFLIEEEKALLDEVRKDLQDYMSENSLDHDTVMDLDDLAQNDASSFLQQDLEKRIAVHLETLQHLEEIPFQNTDTIKPGAIVKINGKKLIIAIAKRPFDYQGEQLEAISSAAPIYKELHGKQTGDSYHFHGENYNIEEVI